MATAADLLVRIDATTEQLRRELKRADRAVDRSSRRMGRSLKRLDQKIALLGRGLPIALVAAAGAAVALERRFVRAASDVEEMQSKFRVVFGDAADDVEAWTIRQAAALNRSKFDLQGYAATVQDTFVPLGFARDVAAEMSKTVVQLAVDLGSFNDSAEPEVIQSLTSALVGNQEAVRRYGIVLTQATLDQELMRTGVAKSALAATELQKAQARLNIILRNSSDAQGDAERTADSYANRIKGLAAALKDLDVEIGGGLMPLTERMIMNWSKAARSLAEFIHEFRDEDGAIELRAIAESIAEINDELERMATRRPIGLDQRRIPVRRGELEAELALLKERRRVLQAAAAAAAAGTGGKSGDDIKPPPVDKALEKLKARVADLRFEARVLRGEFDFMGADAARAAQKLGVLDDAAAELADGTVRLTPEVADLVEAMTDVKNAKDAARVIDDTRTKTERYEAVLKRLNELLKAGAIDQETFTRAVTAAAEDLDDATNSMRDDLKEFGQEFSRVIADITLDTEKGVDDIIDAFKRLALEIAVQRLITRPLENSFNNLLDGLFGAASSGGGSAGIVEGDQGPFDLGDILDLPSFAHGGRPRGPSIVGEAGPEIFVPDVPGTILPNGTGLGGGGGAIVNQTLNISVGVATTVRAEMMDMMPLFAEIAKGTVVDARGRFDLEGFD